MNEYMLFRYLHFLSLFITIGCVTAQQFLIKRELNLKEIKILAISDAIYGVSAIAVALAGLTLWFWVGKPAAFYNNNWIFHLKISAYILVAVFSIFPTLFYLKNRKKLQDGATVKTPFYIVLLVRSEIILLLLIPLLSVLMANGVGYQGE